MPDGGPSGVWLPSSQADYVFYEAATSARHQAQIIGHELGHMAAGHTPAVHQALGRLPSLFLAGGAADLMLLRDEYESAEEDEAETMADALLARIERAAAVAGDDAFLGALRRS
ncbi:hypothetical protein [Motilibacter peucedani]|nr:hypothetical protein [Motilibacter peucedani]